MLTCSNPNKEIKLTMTFGTYEEVYALQTGIIDVLRAAHASSHEVDAGAVLDLLQETLLDPPQLAKLLTSAA